jgi:Tol biopolymer transport system component
MVAQGSRRSLIDGAGSAGPRSARCRGSSVTLLLAVLIVPASFAIAGTHTQVVGSAQDDTGKPLAVPGDSGVPRFGNPLWSPDGRYLALSDQRSDGVYLYDTQAGTCLQITDAPSSGYAFNWSPDGTRLGFKLLIPTPGSVFPLQMPVVFEVQRQELRPLCGPVARAGVPSFSNNGLTAFTVDQELRVVDQSGRAVRVVPLEHYANLAPISPDGTKAACNTPDDQIALIDLAAGTVSILTPGGPAWFNPVWSPDSTLLVASTVSARLKTIEVGTGQVHDLDEGSSPGWAPDGRTILYSRTDRIDGVRVVESDAYQIRWDGVGRSKLTGEAGEREASARLSPDGRSLAFVSLVDGGLYQAPLVKEGEFGIADGGLATHSLGSKVRLGGQGMLVTKLAGSGASTYLETASSDAPPEPAATRVTLLRSMPYIHQVYDTPDSFDGDWACGATSALMAINYFGTLSYWDVTCSWPYSHVSHYGRYVSEIYTYNGHTYNIRGRDASNSWAYGGYGFIIQNNWADTKGFMRDYIINHGLSSSVDWDPTWAKLQAEVDNDDPCVVLNSLTTAGHYITTIGYYTAQHTAIFNDPYGNKNTPGYPSYDGAGAMYDWPGYNNGFQNLNTVHCLIYCRGGLPPVINQHPTNQNVAWAGTASFAVQAAGEGTLSYRWQKDSADLSNGGHYSGVTSAALTVVSATSQEAGAYRCVVSNAYGSTPSDTAVLTVSPPPHAPGDLDGDGDVDQRDFGVFQGCLTGLSVPQDDPACTGARLDLDGDVDQDDMIIFVRCLSGPQVTADMNCAAP